MKFSESLLLNRAWLNIKKNTLLSEQLLPICKGLRSFAHPYYNYLECKSGTSSFKINSRAHKKATQMSVPQESTFHFSIAHHFCRPQSKHTRPWWAQPTQVTLTYELCEPWNTEMKAIAQVQGRTLRVKSRGSNLIRLSPNASCISIAFNWGMHTERYPCCGVIKTPYMQ